MKIILIGPVYPYKGGISHYTGFMCRALREKHEVMMVSYKLQYPKLLFKKEQRDYSNDSFKVENTQYMINTANPVNWMKVAGDLKKVKADVAIIQWWHPYFAPCYYILTRLLKGTKILFVCHNVFPHERFPFDRFLCKLVLKQGDYFITQSQMDGKDLLSIKKDAKHIVTPLPTYNAFKMKNLTKEEARNILSMNSSEQMILFFGFVREYKGLKYLLKAMPIIRESLPELELWVVGDFGDDREEYVKLITEECLEDKIRLVEGYIPDQEVEKYFAATDLVVLPYISATQSAIAQIAYGFEKPIVATDVGGLPDIVDQGKTGYIVKHGDAVELAQAVISFFEKDKGVDWEDNIRQKADEFSWETMVKRIEMLLDGN